ncbi:hypothetical protein FJ471_26280 [Mesorhizobium sp. B2-7-1]|nr:hypothetical protein FJ471_26280 [Mesorhizobium sp. B2-7-1]
MAGTRWRSRPESRLRKVIKFGQKLTDDAVSMFIKLMGRLFSQSNNRKKQRHVFRRAKLALTHFW